MTYNLFLCTATSDSIIIILFNLFFVIQRHKNEIPIHSILIIRNNMFSQRTIKYLSYETALSLFIRYTKNMPSLWNTQSVPTSFITMIFYYLNQNLVYKKGRVKGHIHMSSSIYINYTSASSPSPQFHPILYCGAQCKLKENLFLLLQF